MKSLFNHWRIYGVQPEARKPALNSYMYLRFVVYCIKKVQDRIEDITGNISAPLLNVFFGI